MSSPISSLGSTTSMQTMQSMRGMKRPDPKAMAEQLFSKLDTSGQGYIDKTSLQSAFDKISSASDTSSTNSSTTDVDSLFSQLDSDFDGKVTKQEFSDALSQLTEQLNSQLMSMRMQTGGLSGMPPPPPSEDGGFSKEELTSQLEEIGTSDNTRSELISSIIENFEQADSDGDGLVSFEEAMAYQQSSTATTNSTSTSSAAASSSTSVSELNDKLLQQIMRLLQAYNVGNESDDNPFSALSVLA